MLSLDVPSGVDATTDKAHDPAIKASATMTLALPKVGLLVESAGENIGELHLADISVRPALCCALGLDVDPIFKSGEVQRLQ